MTRSKNRRRVQFTAAAAAFAVLVAACGSDKSTTGAKSSSSADSLTTAPSVTSGATTTTVMMMHLPKYADAYKTKVVTPASDVTVTTNEITVRVDAVGFAPSCNRAGKAPKVGTGHYHVLLDKSLVNMYCTPDATVSLQNVKVGKHTLEVVPALNDHAEVMMGGSELAFDYEPAVPLAPITDVSGNATPTIEIVSPKPGDVVTGDYDVVVKTTNWRNSCDLYGKPGVLGYGHWHVNLDTTGGPMMGMGTMQGMSCTNVFHASTLGLTSGVKHTIIALLVDNGHAPLMPAIESKVQVTVG